MTGCEEGMFGVSCENKCNCENGATCDPTTGTCMCPLGYIGSTCSEPCPRGYTGQGCRHVCKCRNEATCDPENGRCLCPPGYHGDRCQFSKCLILNKAVNICKKNKIKYIQKCSVLSCHVAYFKQNVMKTVLAKSAVENATVLIMVGVTRWQVNVTVTLAGWGTGVISYVHREGLGLPVFTLVYVRTTGHVTQWAVVAAACQGSTDRVVNSVSHISTKISLIYKDW